MKITVRDIPEEGLNLSFDTTKDGWFREIVLDALRDSMGPKDVDTGEVHLFRTNLNVEISGQLECKAHLECSRCASTFLKILPIPIHFTLSPLYENEEEMERRDMDEVELVKEDLEFSFYDGERFNLGELLREQMILSLPIQPVCNEDCKGLCPQCGENLNFQTCSCENGSKDPRWSSLKGLKIKN